MSGSAPRSLGRGGNGGRRRRRASAGAGERGGGAHAARGRGPALGRPTGRGRVVVGRLDARASQAQAPARQGDPQAVPGDGDPDVTDIVPPTLKAKRRHKPPQTRYNRQRRAGIRYRRQARVGLGCSEPPQPQKAPENIAVFRGFSFSDRESADIWEAHGKHGKSKF
ncbi:MAG: hypothetical protein F4178_13745 [Rhodospirillaceae bacterium]|nr:hypothetical protein [Rhodospirillaceae bacterium]